MPGAKLVIVLAGVFIVTRILLSISCVWSSFTATSAIPGSANAISKYVLEQTGNGETLFSIPGKN